MNIKPGMINFKINIPTSKSIANRLLILAAQSEDSIQIKNLPDSDDVMNMLNCFKQIGLEVTEGKVSNSFPECEQGEKCLEVGEGGTTLHFLMGLLSLGKEKYTLKMSEGLSVRPHDELIKALTLLNVKIKQDKNFIYLQGPIKAGTIEVNCSKSSQYASALELIKEKAKLKVIPTNLESSKSFFYLTQKVIQNFKRENKNPLDMASLSYPFVFALLNHKIEIKDLEAIDYSQPDGKIYRLFQENILKNQIIPLRERKAFDLDMNDCIDMIPSLAFLAAYLDGVSKIRGMSNLVYKESNRLEGLCYLLDEFNIQYEIERDTLIISGGDRIREKRDLELEYDHRMVMTGYLFLKHNGGGTLKPSKAVSKSFKNFFESLEIK